MFRTLILYPDPKKWTVLNEIGNVPAIAKLVTTVMLFRISNLYKPREQLVKRVWQCNVGVSLVSTVPQNCMVISVHVQTHLLRFSNYLAILFATKDFQTNVMLTLVVLARKEIQQRLGLRATSKSHGGSRSAGRRLRENSEIGPKILLECSPMIITIPNPEILSRLYTSRNSLICSISRRLGTGAQTTRIHILGVAIRWRIIGSSSGDPKFPPSLLILLPSLKKILAGPSECFACN